MNNLHAQQCADAFAPLSNLKLNSTMETPDCLISTAQNILGMEQLRAERACLWAVILGLRPVQDGNAYCILWGENLQEGIAAFGDTPEEAMCAFDRTMNAKAIVP